MNLVTKDESAAIAEAKPSATVVVVRESSESLEVLLLERSAKLAHMPGVWVFPGGKVDTADTGDTIEARARIAAARELKEEAGFDIDPDKLLPFSHWLTPEIVKRRFATWFYLIAVDANTVVIVDGSEIVDYRWLKPEQALAEQLSGALQAPPPTLVTLTDIEAAGSISQLERMVTERQPPFFFPKLHEATEGMVFLYPGDAGYDTNQLLSRGARHRMVMGPGVFDYERSFDWPSLTH